jgi:hypothetical protein
MTRQVSTLNVLASSQQTPALRQDNIIEIKIRLRFTVAEGMVDIAMTGYSPCILVTNL